MKPNEALYLVKSLKDLLAEGKEEAARERIRTHIKDNVTEADKAGGFGWVVTVLYHNNRPVDPEIAAQIPELYIQELEKAGCSEASAQARQVYAEHKLRLEKVWKANENDKQR